MANRGRTARRAHRDSPASFKAGRGGCAREPAVGGLRFPAGRNSAKLLGETQPAVTVGTAAGFRKHVNRLARKNPFIQQARGGGGSAGGQTAQLPGSATPTGETTPTTTTPTTTKPTSTDSLTLYRYVAKVEFGKISATKDKNLDPGDFLPSESNPSFSTSPRPMTATGPSSSSRPGQTLAATPTASRATVTASSSP